MALPAQTVGFSRFDGLVGPAAYFFDLRFLFAGLRNEFDGGIEERRSIAALLHRFFVEFIAVKSLEFAWLQVRQNHLIAASYPNQRTGDLATLFCRQSTVE